MFETTHPDFWPSQYRRALRQKVEDLCSSTSELDVQGDDQIMYPIPTGSVGRQDQRALISGAKAVEADSRAILPRVPHARAALRWSLPLGDAPHLS